jgi:hypothetical protein
MNEQPEALRLITWFESLDSHDWYQWMEQADEELLRLHEVNQDLVEALEMCINNPWREGTMEYDVLMQVAKAALAKARGTE